MPLNIKMNIKDYFYLFGRPTKSVFFIKTEGKSVFSIDRPSKF